MATPLGTTFSTDEQVMAQGDVNFMGKTVESLVIEFDLVKHEEFLSFGSKSPRVARQYRKVSLEICSQVSLKTSPKMACVNSAISGRVACVARIVSYETRETNDVEGQSCRASPLNIPQFQITGGSQQPVKHNQNVER